MGIKRSVLVRILISTVVLGSGAFIYFVKDSRNIAFYLSVILASVYFLSLLYLLLESFFVNRNTLFKYFQVITDVFLISVVVLVTGTVTSPFIFLYPLVIIFSCIFLSKFASYMVTGLICILYIIVVILGLLILNHLSISNIESVLDTELLIGENGLFIVYFHLVGFIMLAVLGGYLSERISVTREELGESKKSLDILQNLHENILQSLTSGVITLDFDGDIISINESGLKIIGIDSVKKVVGKHLSDFFEGVNIQELLDKKREELIYKMKKGREMILGFSASMLRDSKGVNHGYTIIFQDLTEIRNLEDRVKESEKLALLGQLSAGLAHELRNPLSAISGSVEILSSDISEDNDYYRLVKVASREVERVNLIVEDFLLLTVPVDDYKTNPVEIGYIIRQTSDSFIATVKRNDLKIDTDIEKGLFIKANAYRLKQVFWNLLTNAMDSMRNGGKIKIKCYKDNDSIKILFSDQGTGIDEELIPRVFDPFFTTKEVGTGLGLAIVQKIIEGYKGDIKLISKKDRGTDFIITFPYTDTVISSDRSFSR